MRRGILLVFALALMSTFALAQVPTSGNVFLGYSINHAKTGLTNSGTLNGWEAALQGNFAPHVGMVADVGAQYGNLTVSGTDVKASAHVESYLFGPRVSVTVQNLQPFFHVLIGAGHQHATASSIGFAESSTSFSDAFGGGIDYHLAPAVAWRFQLDDLQTRFHSTRQDDTRFSTGIVVKF